MQVTETLNSGLKREIKITVPAGDMEAKLMARLNDARDKVRINGFRPGKVPVQHLRKMYGKSFMAEVVNEILNDSTRSIISGRGEKAAMQPEVIMTEDEKEAEKILAVGADAGDEKLVTVTFPENYQAAHLAGKEATFDVTVKDVAKPGELEINDETAKNLGLESVERLRDIVRGQIENQFGSMTRQKVKRQLLDQLDAAYSFEAPSKLVEAEFNNIWAQVNRDLEA